MAKEYGYIPLNSSYATREDSYIASNGFHILEGFDFNNYFQTCVSSFDFEITNKSVGEIFNIYENLILNSQWDVRDNGDNNTIILGREYMFYSVDNTFIRYGSFSKKTEEEIKQIEQKECNPINFFVNACEELVQTLHTTEVFDNGTIVYINEKIKSSTISNTNSDSGNLKKQLERNGCRKFSENHFAISGFNLVTHSIKMNNEVVNTVSEIISKKDESEKNTISILGDVTESYIVEMSFEPILSPSSLKEDEDNAHRSDEALANKLLEELRYVYQGSIIIKYNPDIEIGDTITLLDNVNSIFGIFQIDSFEHSLDQKGLITNLVVRASWTTKDPLLDYHSQDVGYKLIQRIKEQMKISEYVYDKKNPIYKLISLYLKYLVQSPKYCVFYKKKEKGFFNSSTVQYNNVSSPTALPLRFYPMYKKGKAQIPKNIQYAFASGADTNDIKNIIFAISAKIEDLFKDFISGFAKGSLKLIYFLGDILMSTVTFNMNELIKPLLGMTAAKARENTYDEINKIDNEDALSMLQYNPYEKKYRLMHNNDNSLVFGFFNVRFQSVEDLFAYHRTEERNSENAVSLLNKKINVIRKMLTDVFDCLLMVEVYDSFNTNETKIENGLIENEETDRAYNFNDFLDDCTIDGYSLDSYLPIIENTYGKEYGAVIKNNKLSSFVYRTIKLDGDDRNAIEVIVDIEKNNIMNNLNETQQIKKLKIAFFHNLYGDSLYDKGQNAIEIRKRNIDSLLSKYQSEAVSNDTGVIIMADFNMNVYNEHTLPYKSNGTDINYTYMLRDSSNFKAQIKSPTTLNQYGYLKGNQYDNVLLSKNIIGKVSAKVFEYPDTEKLTVSDHIPLYVAINFEEEKQYLYQGS